MSFQILIESFAAECFQYYLESNCEVFPRSPLEWTLGVHFFQRKQVPGLLNYSLLCLVVEVPINDCQVGRKDPLELI